MLSFLYSLTPLPIFSSLYFLWHSKTLILLSFLSFSHSLLYFSFFSYYFFTFFSNLFSSFVLSLSVSLVFLHFYIFRQTTSSPFLLSLLCLFPMQCVFYLLFYFPSLTLSVSIAAILYTFLCLLPYPFHTLSAYDLILFLLLLSFFLYSYFHFHLLLYSQLLSLVSDICM